VSAQEQLVRAQDEFIMNAAHELRGPLASLRASVELLVEDHISMAPKDLGLMLKTMQTAVIKFQGLVENLLDLGTVQAGRFRVSPAPTRLKWLLDDAITQIRPLLERRSQRLDLTESTSHTILADRIRITQVLSNLLTNASKYSPEGSVIGLNASEHDGFVFIEVTDQGAGIEPDELPNLFQRFYRGRRAAEGSIGTGLGLALAREIVRAHGGQMDVKSEPGQGATFWFSLPLAASAQNLGSKADSQNAQSSSD
jgi:signal transduction histidine kinase